MHYIYIYIYIYALYIYIQDLCITPNMCVYTCNNK